MMELFNFMSSGNEKTKIRESWSEFRLALAQKQFSYDDIQSALDTVFLKGFDDLFSQMKTNVEKSASVLKSVNFIRGARIKSDETPEYSRFIPNFKYINDDNRFSPPGVEWLYLALGEKKEDALACAKAECRVKSQDRFAACEFTINKAVYENTIVDLTIADSLSQNEINNALERAGQDFFTKLKNRSMVLGYLSKADSSEEANMRKEIAMWALKTYLKLLSEQIFIPLNNTDDKKLMYTPFQCLAQYFRIKGYIGIMYKSTVSAVGKNLVLFDKTYASPMGKIYIEEPTS